jgi:hypothetical protein
VRANCESTFCRTPLVGGTVLSTNTDLNFGLTSQQLDLIFHRSNMALKQHCVFAEEIETRLQCSDACRGLQWSIRCDSATITTYVLLHVGLQQHCLALIVGLVERMIDPYQLRVVEPRLEVVEIHVQRCLFLVQQANE